MVKFEVHTSPDEPGLQHRAAPSRASNGDLNWLGTEFRMSRDHHGVFTQKSRRVEVMLGSNLENGGRRQLFQKYAALNLRLGDVPIDFVGEIGMRPEHDSLTHCTGVPHRVTTAQW